MWSLSRGCCPPTVFLKKHAATEALQYFCICQVHWHMQLLFLFYLSWSKMFQDWQRWLLFVENVKCCLKGTKMTRGSSKVTVLPQNRSLTWAKSMQVSNPSQQRKMSTRNPRMTVMTLERNTFRFFCSMFRMPFCSKWICLEKTVKVTASLFRCCSFHQVWLCFAGMFQIHVPLQLLQL